MTKVRHNLAEQVVVLGADSLLPPLKLSKPQRRELEYAARSQFGLTGHSLPISGVGANARRQMMDRLCLMGLFKPYVHGGWEITEAGRAAIADLPTVTAIWCPFCKKEHVGGDTCMGHHP